MIEGVIFDLDGTLANTLHVSIAAFKKALEPLTGRTLSSEEIMNTFGPTEEGTVRALAGQHHEKGLSDYLINYKKLHHLCPEPFVGIVEVLEYLKKRRIRLAIVTGKGKISTRISLDFLGLTDYFDIIETGSPDKSIKEESIKKVIQAWKVISKKSIIYVGDTTVDIEASNNVGIPIVSVAWSDLANKRLLKKFNPNNIYYSVSDFADWIKTKV